MYTWGGIITAMPKTSGMNSRLTLSLANDLSGRRDRANQAADPDKRKNSGMCQILINWSMLVIKPETVSFLICHPYSSKGRAE
jgi:hypothetical protein